MAKRFGVATVTAREALEALRDKGLVATRRGRDGGSFVTAGRDKTRSVLDARVRSLSRVELRDMGTYYSSIAGSCAALAADRATDDDLERVRGIALVADDDETAARRRQGMFQLEIAALSQSARLVREELRLQSEFAPLLWLWLREHRDIRRGQRGGCGGDRRARRDARGARPDARRGPHHWSRLRRPARIHPGCALASGMVARPREHVRGDRAGPAGVASPDRRRG